MPQTIVPLETPQSRRFEKRVKMICYLKSDTVKLK